MKIIKNITVPTGDILIVEGEKGKLECLSIGDYGKEKNIKADFLGLPNEINGVPNGPIMPLSEKWVITISSQYGCSMGCKFCDVPKVGPGINATFDDLIGQVMAGISLHPEITYTKRLNVHFARMGEPLFNESVLDATLWLAGYFKKLGWGFHPVVSTIFPEAKSSYFLHRWSDIKNNVLKGNAGLQISVNTTSYNARLAMFNTHARSLFNISTETKFLPKPVGRKYTLNFALTDSPVDAEMLAQLFNPDYWMCKITPMHLTKACQDNNLLTKDGYEKYYPYKKVEEDLKKAGFDVIVFIPSKEEDESRITCGNAILADK